jgi:hypothetical protein
MVHWMRVYDSEKRTLQPSHHLPEKGEWAFERNQGKIKFILQVQKGESAFFKGEWVVCDVLFSLGFQQINYTNSNSEL